MNYKVIETLTCCPFCKTEIEINDKTLACKKCKRKFVIKNGIVDFLEEVKENTWELLYQQNTETEKYKQKEKEYENLYLKDTIDQLEEVASPNVNKVYLEIGCGYFFLGKALAHKYKYIIGIDNSYTALKIAHKILSEARIKNFILIRGDLNKIPIKKNSIDLIYGGGVIEHIQDTQGVVQECYRVLRSNGRCFNTVPLLNLGSLTYRQFWGNIPELPILKGLASFIHIKLLNEKHMRFGYEKSFLPITMRKYYKKAGFKKIKVQKFDVNIMLEHMPKCFRKIAMALAKKTPLFWPMIKVIGIK